MPRAEVRPRPSRRSAPRSFPVPPSPGMSFTMASLDLDTCVSGGAGRYRGDISPAWEVWGPNGGYVAAIALRAAGAEARIARPVAFAGHYLSVARFAPVDLAVVVTHRGRRSESIRVTMTQDGKPILEVIVRTAAETPGLAH